MKKVRKRITALLLTAVFILSCSFVLGYSAAAEETGEEIYHHYIGMIHGHTEDSDGTGTPDEAYAWARDQIGFDFFGITDHAHMLKRQEKFDEQRATADSYNKDGEFVTFPGFEMSYYSDGGWWGHLNTFGTEWIELGKSMSEAIDYYYGRLKNSPTSFSQFNHPGYAWGEFDDFGHYDKDIDAVMNLIEVVSGTEPMYIHALDKGWHVSPTNNDDNHSAKWGSNGAATVIIAKNLTRTDLIEAVRANRTYSTQDSSLRMEFTGNGSMMGSRLSGIDKLTLNVKVDYQTDTVGSIKIYTNGGQLVASTTVDGNTADWTVDVPVGDNTYYFARVITGNEKYAVSAPIWVENGEGLRTSDNEIGMNQSDPERPYEVKFNLKNTSEEAITDLTIRLSRKGRAQGDEYVLPMLAAGAQKEIRIPAAYEEGAQDVTVWIQGMKNGVSVGTSLTVNLPDLLMTEFLPSNAKGDFLVNGFPFVEVYNASPTAKNLADYKVYFYTWQGDSTPLDITESIVVPSYGTALLWLKNEDDSEIMALKKQDFIRYFKTFYNSTLTEENVAELPYNFLASVYLTNSVGHGFRLCTDDGYQQEFIRYNHGYQFGENVYADNSLKYTYQRNGLSLGVICQYDELITPGKVEPAEIPYAAKGATVWADQSGVVALADSVLKEDAMKTALAGAKGDSVSAYLNGSAGEATVTLESGALQLLSESASVKKLVLNTGVGGAIIGKTLAKTLSATGGDVVIRLTKSGENTLSVGVTAGGAELSSFDPPLLLSAIYSGSEDGDLLYAKYGDTMLPQSAYSPEYGGMLIKASVPGAYSVASGKVDFTDIEGSWAANSIRFLSARGIIGGAFGQFKPLGTLTQAEFIKMLAALSGEELSLPQPGDPEAASGAWYAPYLSWAEAKGIAEAGLVPDGKITRVEMAEMLYRLAREKFGYVPAASGEAPFADDSEIPGDAKDAVYTLKSAGVLGGRQDGKFAPGGNATRAEAAKMLSTFLCRLVTAE